MFTENSQRKDWHADNQSTGSKRAEESAEED